MLSNVALHCPHCEKRFFESVPYIEGQIKAMKQDKAREVAHQLHEKRGPFYDKWLAAMEKRGEQKRCGDCTFYEWELEPDSGCEKRPEVGKVNSGRFACSFFIDYLEV